MVRGAGARRAVAAERAGFPDAVLAVPDPLQHHERPLPHTPGPPTARALARTHCNGEETVPFLYLYVQDRTMRTTH